MSSSDEPEKSQGERILPKYRDHGGYLVAGGFPVEGFGSALKYEARDDDLFVVTYPKVSFRRDEDSVRRDGREVMGNSIRRYGTMMTEDFLLIVPH
jgi:hypothetical protein